MDVPVERPVIATEGRLMSLDALRGFDMFWIIGGHTILVGLGKGLGNEWFNQHITPQIDHVPWEGFTAWDLIMPLFLFIVGTAMPFSFAKRLQQGLRRRHPLADPLLYVSQEDLHQNIAGHEASAESRRTPHGWMSAAGDALGTAGRWGIRSPVVRIVAVTAGENAGQR